MTITLWTTILQYSLTMISSGFGRYKSDKNANIVLLMWQECWPRYFCFNYGWRGWASDNKWAMLCLNEWWLYELLFESPAWVGVWLKLANGWEDKQNLLEGRENGRSSKPTLVWAERSIYHLELILGSIWTKVDHLWLQMVDLIEKCTGMVRTPE